MSNAGFPGGIAGTNLWPVQNVANLSQKDYNDLSTRYANMLGTATEPGFGGLGLLPEKLTIGETSIPLPTHGINKALGTAGNYLKGNHGKSPFEIAGYAAMGTTGFTPVGSPSMAGGNIGSFVPGAGNTQFGALLPSPSSVAGGNGGFSTASSDLFGIVAPKLAAKDATLTQLRAKIASGADLHPNELLMYQDLMQQQNQLFMFAQNVFTSEHEKVKGWAQGLGRI